MTILAIETSCDDTCVAILKIQNSKFKIQSNIISSQVEIHKKYGGVYPMLAKREHQKNLPIILKKVLRKTKIDLIAVTIGPGLEPCLWVGVNFAKELSRSLGVPIIPVNHIEAHILVNFIDKLPDFPAITLVVSGGHTQLILIRDIGKYKILGETRDDAAGECFDKTARILGLGYPGGPIIEKIASKSRGGQISLKLPRPMMNQKNYDFSFSGLKTAVLYKYKKTPKKINKDKKYIQAMCAEIQQAVVDVLIKKTIKAAKNYRAKTIILGGGVAANDELRKQFRQKLRKEKQSFKFYVPSFKFCTDNAVMVAITGYFRWRQGKTENWKDVGADANLRIC